MSSDPSDELSTALTAQLLISSLETSGESGRVGSKEKSEAKAMKASPKAETTDNLYDRWSLKEEATIQYSHFGEKKKGAAECDPTKERFYITTAINYTNGPGHMGHAYEATTSDAIARYNRLKLGSNQTYFVTGSDEHGQKIANTAANQTPPVKPIELCDKYVTGFQVLNQRILISNNDYIRTTSARHQKTAQELWKRCALAKDGEDPDIYLDSYEGWYNEREETFVTDKDAKLADYKDPSSGKPLEKVKESSYFFRMSKYHDRLVEHIENNNFIQPEQYKKNILTRLTDDRLRDLSVSRTTFEWGIPVPEGFDDKHVMYVWFDALSNYLTGVNGLSVNGEGDDSTTMADNFWPADVHIIGKDILWFHTVIWPCILMSAGIPLPKTVFAHGFVNDKEGKKMSKSLGNVVDPHDMLDKYPVDTFRWYLCKEAPYGGELSFSEESLMTMHNADLCDTLGNLIHRATNLCKVNCGRVIPDVPPPSTIPLKFDEYRKEFMSEMDTYRLDNAASLAMKAFRDVNGYLTEQAPWKMKGDDKATERQIVVRSTLEAVYALAHFLAPFLPNGAAAIFTKLNTPPKKLKELDSNLRNLSAGTEISIGDVLYTKLQSEEEKRQKLSAEAIKKKNAADYAEAQRLKKEKQKKAAQSSKSGQKNDASNANQPDFTKMDIRVGKIVKVWNHTEADKLFCEEIAVGEEEGRQITSGLRGHYELSDLQDRKVLVVCNLKASKIVGFSSHGMVLAAKSEDGSKVELITPPDDAKVGERVFIDGLTGEPFSPAQVKKKKVFNAVAKTLKTGEGGVATWEGKEIKCSAGVCAAASLVGAAIS